MANISEKRLLVNKVIKTFVQAAYSFLSRPILSLMSQLISRRSISRLRNYYCTDDNTLQRKKEA